MYQRRGNAPLIALCSMLGASSCSDPWVTVQLEGGDWQDSVHVSVTYEEDEQIQLGTPFDAAIEDRQFSFHIPKDSGRVRLTVSTTDSTSGKRCYKKILVAKFSAAGSKTGMLYSLHSDALQTLSPYRCDCEKGWCRVSDTKYPDNSWNAITGRQTKGSNAQVWIVGDKNNSILWNGAEETTMWIDEKVGNPASIFPIYTTLYDGDNIYAAGQLTISNWDTSWHEDAAFSGSIGGIDPFAREFRSLWSEHSEKYWFAGAHVTGPDTRQALIISGPSSVKIELDSGMYPTLYGIWGFNHSELWSVGAGGTILLGDGTRWIVPPNIKAASIAALTPDLRSIWGINSDTGPSRIWTVGSGGTIWRLQDSIWSPESVRTEKDLSPETLYSVWGLDFRDVWAVGSNGLILHYDGQSWAQMPTPSAAKNNTLRGIWGPDRESIWLVGANGTVLIREP